MARGEVHKIPFSISRLHQPHQLILLQFHLASCAGPVHLHSVITCLQKTSPLSCILASNSSSAAALSTFRQQTSATLCFDYNGAMIERVYE